MTASSATDGGLPLGVTGATGGLGGAVAARLATRGVAQVLLVRDPGRAPRLAGAAVRRVDYGDGEGARRALEGLGAVLMVSAAEAPDRVEQHRSFIDAAAAAGVGHLVYTSFLGAGPAATFTLARDHWHTEEHLRASGLPHTILRDGLYADVLPLWVGEDGALRGPAGRGRVAAVARADVAEAAVAVLIAPGPHAGRTYDLTGPEALTLEEAAAILSEETGTPVRYVPETVPEAYRSRERHGAPPWQVEAWVSTYTAIAAGEMAGVSDHVRRLTGRPATSLRQLLRAAGARSSRVGTTGPAAPEDGGPHR